MNGMHTPERIIVIPARHGSTRFPGKPLANLHGAGGKPRPLIERTIVAPVEARLAAAANRKASQVAATKVDFFTLVRGEDA